MSSSVDDIAAKAEARRKRILENSERRMNIALGKPTPSTISENNSSDDVCRGQDLLSVTSPKNVNFDNQTYSYNVQEGHMSNSSSSSSIADDTLSITNGMPFQMNGHKDFAHLFPPEVQENLSNFPKLSTFHMKMKTNLPYPLSQTEENLDNSETNCSQNIEHQKKSIIFWLFYYIILGVVVRILFHFNLGYLFGEMIIIPFLLSECIQISLGYLIESSLAQVLFTAMLFLGFPSHLIQYYTKLISILFHCLEDYSVYFVTFCIVHNLMSYSQILEQR